MEDSSTVFKVLMFLTFSLPLSSSDTHSLQFFHTAIKHSEDQMFTAVGLVDGQHFLYDTRIPETEWIIKFIADHPDYWKYQIQVVKDQQHLLQDTVARVLKSFNQTEGNHTLQWMLGCGLDNGTIRGYSQYRYDGEDFFSLDLNWNLKHGDGTWTAANDEAKNFLMEWDPKGEKAEHRKEYLKNECIDQLNKLVPYNNKTLKWEDPPTSSVFQKHSPFPEVVCHATGFFPRELMIFWRKDGEDVNEDVELRVTFSNQDGSFQKRIILKVPAEDLQKHKYTCVIQHSSLKEEMVLEVPKGEGSDVGSGGAVIGTIIGVVALIAVSTGVIVWKNKKMPCAEQPHKVQQKETEISPLSTPHSDVPA